jgi:hypothetical protein
VIIQPSDAAVTHPDALPGIHHDPRKRKAPGVPQGLRKREPGSGSPEAGARKREPGSGSPEAGEPEAGEPETVEPETGNWIWSRGAGELLDVVR